MRTIFATILLAGALLIVGVPAASATSLPREPVCTAPIELGAMQQRPPFHSDCPTYKGWGTVSQIGPDHCYWRGCMIALIASPVESWTYANARWNRSSIMQGEWVYAWPYGSAGWSWAWHYNSRTWHAMRSDRITMYVG